MNVEALSKEIEEFMDHHCECPSKNFNRAACIEQIILHHIAGGKFIPFKPTAITLAREENE